MADKTKDEKESKRPTIEFVKGEYSDGHPLHEINYIESKIILRGERFTSVKSFHDFSRLVAKAAQATKVDYDIDDFVGQRPKIREVLFLDTKDFKLYNNSFILRRRLGYEDGFPMGEPEIVFKFRHPDLKTAAEMDVRPLIRGKHKVKFKTEILPLKEKIGGIRELFSHNVEFPLSAVPPSRVDMKIVMTGRYTAIGAPPEQEDTSLAALIEILPALKNLKGMEQEKVGFVNHTAVEEVLLDLGMLDFGKGIQSKANVSVWRTRGDQRQLVGEFSYQSKISRDSDVSEKALARTTEFFCELQKVASDWISLGTTKTGAVYRLRGMPSSSHE